MKNLLVPVDFSENATRALRWAARLCARSGATLHLLHVYTILESPFIDRKSLREAYNAQRRQEIIDGLLRLRREMLDAIPGIAIEVHLYTGATVAGILACAQEKDAEMVIMGTQGATGLTEMLVGSTAAAVLARSAVPVLCIPRACHAETPESIILATDNVETDTRLLEPVFDLAKSYDIPVKVVAFEPWEEQVYQTASKSMQLDDYATLLEKQYAPANVSAWLVEGPRLDVALRQFCEKEGTPVLSMITYPREGFWEKLLRPSQTRKMALHTNVPLLAIPALPHSVD
jgi:nucleotide-binding universal stress UspA family protein